MSLEHTMNYWFNEFTVELEHAIMQHCSAQADKEYMEKKYLCLTAYNSIIESMEETNIVDYFNTLWDYAFDIIRKYGIRPLTEVLV